MKILFTTLTIISILIATQHKAQAIDITVGATSWYVQSEQYYAQDKGGGRFLHNTLIKSDPALLYGPTLSLRLTNDFNLTFVYLYGNFVTVKDTGNHKSRSKFKRSDSDLALNYRLNDYFKVFAGFKYLSYGITPAEDDSKNFKLKKIDTHSSYGSGLGLSATLPLIGDLFCLGTLSGLYLWGADGVVIEELISGVSTGNTRSSNISYNAYGFNSTLSLAYYIAQASTVISLGGRFQYLKADYKKNIIYLDSIEFTSYGVTLSAAYTFGLCL
jgi:hypothetical protein